jgi:hypothetical protein
MLIKLLFVERYVISKVIYVILLLKMEYEPIILNSIRNINHILNLERLDIVSVDVIL